MEANPKNGAEGLFIGKPVRWYDLSEKPRGLKGGVECLSPEKTISWGYLNEHAKVWQTNIICS